MQQHWSHLLIVQSKTTCLQGLALPFNVWLTSDGLSGLFQDNLSIKYLILKLELSMKRRGLNQVKNVAFTSQCYRKMFSKVDIVRIRRSLATKLKKKYFKTFQNRSSFGVGGHFFTAVQFVRPLQKKKKTKFFAEKTFSCTRVTIFAITVIAKKRSWIIY